MQDDFTNVLLIATPALNDSLFKKTVIYIVEHNDGDGAFGVVLNRPGGFPLTEACKQLGFTETQHAADITFAWGGPVNINAGFVLHTPKGGWKMTVHQNDVLAVTISPDIIGAIAKGEGPEKSFMALGCASWSAGQLEGEVERGSWFVAPMNASIVFDLPMLERYDAALFSIGVLPQRSLAAFSSERTGHA